MNSKTEYFIITRAHKSLWPKHCLLFWRPNECGYTPNIDIAGRYSREEAEAICAPSQGMNFMVPCSEVEQHAVSIVDANLFDELVGRAPREEPYEYVKRHYGVNPVIGTRVALCIEARRPIKYGVIVRKRCYDAYVHVRFDGSKFDVPVYPLELLYEAPGNPPGLKMPATERAGMA